MPASKYIAGEMDPNKNLLFLFAQCQGKRIAFFATMWILVQRMTVFA